MNYKITAVKGDITEQSTDAVVNAANEQLLGGAGVSGAIFDAAGYEDMTNACRKIGYCEVGEAVITPGFQLPARYVIHAVGPVYGQNGGNDAELLRSTYWSSLARAEENNLTSITFPLIATGVYGYPKDEAIQIAIHAIHDYFSNNEPHSLQDIQFCAWSDDDYRLVSKYLQQSIYKKVNY